MIGKRSNGWLAEETGSRFAISLNLSGIKETDPVVPTAELVAELMADRLAPFGQKLAQCVTRQAKLGPTATDSDPVLMQRLHMALIEARMRIRYLEEQLQK